MGKWILILEITLLGIVGCGHKGEVDLIPIGSRVPAPPIKADYLNSSTAADLALDHLKGKVVILDFWATWCGPCRMELPYLVKLYNAYHSKGLEMEGLSVEINDGRPMDYFRQFISTNGLNYPIGLASIDTLRNYGIQPIPTTFFLDKKGKVALSFVGVHSEENFTEAIEKLLAE